jgi:hypothetical protein
MVIAVKTKLVQVGVGAEGEQEMLGFDRRVAA